MRVASTTIVKPLQTKRTCGALSRVDCRDMHWYRAYRRTEQIGHSANRVHGALPSSFPSRFECRDAGYRVQGYRVQGYRARGALASSLSINIFLIHLSTHPSSSLNLAQGISVHGVRRMQGVYKVYFPYVHHLLTHNKAYFPFGHLLTHGFNKRGIDYSDGLQALIKETD